MADKEKKSLLQRAGQKLVGWAMDGGSTEDNLKMSSGAGDDISQSSTPLNEKKEEPKKEQSLLANKYGDPQNMKWADVLRLNDNDLEKSVNWMNNNPGYKPGSVTKKAMEDGGYALGEDGKWAPKPKTETPATTTPATTTPTTTPTTTTPTTTDSTTETGTTTTPTADEVQKRLEELENQNKDLQGQIEAFKTNKDAWDEYQQKLFQSGALTMDKDGNYRLRDTTKKGWEDWATILSAGASVIGIAMGVPIIPINFRAITGKDKKDAAVRELQKQLIDVSAGNAARLKDLETRKKAGDYYKANKESIDLYSEHEDRINNYKKKSTIDTDSEKELIETRTAAQIKADQAKFDNDMKRLEADNNFKLNYAYLQNKYAKDFAEFTDALATNSAKELLRYQNTDMLKEIQQMIDEKQIDFTDMAQYAAMKQGIRPSDVTWNRFMQGVKTGLDAINTATDAYATVTTGGLNKIGQK